MERLSKLFRQAAIVAALACAFAMTAYADDSRFVTGTTINGLGVGGLTVEEAKARLEGFYASDYKLTIRKKGGSSETIQGSDIGYVVTVPEGLQAILDAQNASGRNAGPAVDNSHTMQMTAQYDADALTARIGGLGCLTGQDIVVTQDAHISPYQEGQPFTIIPEVHGNNVDPARVAAAVQDAVAGGKGEVSLEEAGCYYTVNVTADNEELKALCDAMNQCREMVITYQFGDSTETLDGASICSWITGAENGQIGLNRDGVAAYVQTLAAKYDTAGRPRTFRTHRGAEVSLSGPYGWQIDQAAEIDALMAMIRTAQSQTREPQYAKSAASRSGADWGGTYVEVDLGGQHVYLYKDGAVVWDAPCVTGNVSKGHTTPDGIYGLYYKQRDRVLRGAKRADGSYEYESPVKYWMPFNNGIGLHDADWRGSFGGSIYKNGGSHGCINLPPSKTKALFDMVYAGMPVICHN